MLSATLLSLVLTAVPGTPEPQPGDTGEDGVLVTWGNDAFGMPPGSDDYRTNQVSAWVRYDGWNLALDYSMLTTRDYDARTDEVTATIGYELVPGLTLGVGYRSRGDYGGEDVQQAAHHLIGVADAPPMEYNDQSHALLGYFVYVTGEMEGGVGYRSITSALLCTDGDGMADQAAHAVVTWRWLTVWGGTRYHWRLTPDDAGTARHQVDDFEEGLWVDLGVRFGHLAFETSYNHRDESAVGSVTVFVGF